MIDIVINIFSDIIFIIISNCFKYNRKIKGDFIYINTNKKILDIREIEKVIDLKKYKKIMLNKLYTTKTYKPKRRIKRMKRIHDIILRSKFDGYKFYYAGFLSVPMAFYDGYKVNNTLKVKFLEYSKEDNLFYEVIDRKKYRKTKSIEIIYPKNIEVEVNIVISSSFHIHENINIRYISKASIIKIIDNNYIDNNKRITTTYLDENRNKFSEVLKILRKNNVKKINVFCASRQSVSFTFGTCVQPYDPEIVIYENNNNKYIWGLNLKNGKVNFVDI